MEVGDMRIARITLCFPIYLMCVMYRKCGSIIAANWFRSINMISTHTNLFLFVIMDRMVILVLYFLYKHAFFRYLKTWNYVKWNGFGENLLAGMDFCSLEHYVSSINIKRQRNIRLLTQTKQKCSKWPVIRNMRYFKIIVNSKQSLF